MTKQKSRLSSRTEPERRHRGHHVVSACGVLVRSCVVSLLVTLPSSETSFACAFQQAPSLHAVPRYPQQHAFLPPKRASPATACPDRSPRRDQSTSQLLSSVSAPQSTNNVVGSVTSNLISNLAECAIKLRLAAHSSVSCELSADPTADLFGGSFHVGPVTVKGKNWQSELGLKCRAIEATVKSCKIDMGKVLRDRKLRFVNPAHGDSMVALDGSDFTSFVTHPSIEAPLIRSGKSEGSVVERFVFSKDEAIIDSLKKEVTFRGIVAGREWVCTLERKDRGGGAVVQVQRSGQGHDLKNYRVEDAMELSQALTRFFNTFVLKLDGVELSFRDMMVAAPRRVAGGDKSNPNLLLALNIKVHKLPSVRMAF